MMLYFADGQPFTVGQMAYRDHPKGATGLSRIVIIALVEGLPVEAVLDTGGAFLICNPELVEWLGLRPGTGMPARPLQIRGASVRGELHRVTLALEAQAGENIVVEATAFAPQWTPGLTWDLPVILGLQGCLEFIRFAVDPETNTFYFGATTA